jgi:hypothetical protein
VVLREVHVDVLLSANRDGGVHRHGDLGGRAQALLWQRVAGRAKDKEVAWVEGEPELVGIGDAARS